MAEQFIILFGFILLIFSAQALFFLFRYKGVEKDNLLVVTGKLDPENKLKFKIIKSGKIFVWPIIQDF